MSDNLDDLLASLKEPIEVEIPTESPYRKQRSYARAYREANRRLKATHKKEYKEMCKEIRAFSNIDYPSQVQAAAQSHLRNIYKDEFRKYLREERNIETQTSKNETMLL